MWFARFFGGRGDEGADEQPTAVSPPATASTQAITRPPAKPAGKLPGKARVVDPKRKGFDPYNSGSFERHNAWERVGRR